jgi:hypothetical protein
MNARLERSKVETINNLITKRVVCLNAIWNVGRVGEDQNDQVSTQGLLVFFGDEYNNENSESLVLMKMM